jgi:hypothetical protein
VTRLRGRRIVGAVLWSLLSADLLTRPGGLAALGVVLVAALLATVLVRRAADRTPARVPVRAVTVRERARRAAPIRHSDPDAAGRPRPRAPSA